MIEPGLQGFCERCGTRVGGDAPEPRRLSGLVDLALGRSSPVPDNGLRLCLGCRGYVCPACINEAEGVCLTCAPLPEVEIPVEIAVAPDVEPPPEPLPVAASAQPEPAPVPEPVAASALPEPAPVPEPEPLPVAATVEPEPEVAPTLGPQPRPVAAPRRPVRRLPYFRLPRHVRPAPPMPELSLPQPQPLPPAAPLAPRFTPPVARPHESPQPIPPLPIPAMTQASLPPPIPFARPSVVLPAAPLAEGLRACLNCNLPLSARAGFCRRCGSAQPQVA